MPRMRVFHMRVEDRASDRWCAWCGEEMRGRQIWRRQKFCSRACRIAYFRDIAPKRKCPVCGTLFQASKKGARNNPRQYCCRLCYRKDAFRLRMQLASKVHRLRIAGVPFREIATRFGRTAETCRRLYRESCEPKVPCESDTTEPWTEERFAKAFAMWKEDYSASKIAAALGGTTRAAVLGKFYSQGLTKRELAARGELFTKGTLRD